MVGNLNMVKGIQMETHLDRLAFISLKLINNDLHRCKGLAEILSSPNETVYQMHNSNTGLLVTIL